MMEYVHVCIDQYSYSSYGDYYHAMQEQVFHLMSPMPCHRFVPMEHQWTLNNKNNSTHNMYVCMYSRF